MNLTKFYELKYATDLHEVGIFPQSDFYRMSPPEGTPKYQNWSRTEFYDQIEAIRNIFIERKAKLTDMISNVHLRLSSGIILSTQLLELIHKFRSGPFHTYPIVWNQPPKGDKEYVFFHLIEDSEAIQYEKSCVVNYVNPNEVLPVYQHADLKTLIETQKKLGAWKKVHWKTPVDIFRLPFQTNIYISERLYLAMKNEGISGYKVLDPYFGNEMSFDEL